MANEIIRPSELPIRTNPVPSEVVPSDNNVTVAGVSWEDGVNSAVPPASQSESEAGVINSKRMTPLTTKQAIDAQVPPKIAAAINNLNLGTMSQETAADYTPTSGLAAVALSNEYGDLDNLPTLGTAAAADTGDFATAAQGALADSAVQPSNPALIPPGGSTSQVLIKSSNTDYDTEWTTSAAATAVSYAPQVLTDEQRLQAQSNLSLVNFKTVQNLLADELMSYADDPGKIQVGAGDAIEAQGFRYEVAASDATDAHVETAGGVRLRVIWNADTTVEAWGADAALEDNSPYFEKSLEVSGRAIGKPGRVYKFNQRVPIKNSVVIDLRGAGVQWGGSSPQTASNADLFVLTADVDYVRIFNVGSVHLTGVGVGDYCYKNFYSSFEDSSTIIGFPQGPNLKSWRARQTVIQRCNFGAARVQSYGEVEQGDALDYLDNSHIDDKYVIRPASLQSNGHLAPNILRNRFEAHFYEDIVKASPSIAVKMQHNVFRQAAPNGDMTQGFIGQVDVYSGVHSDDISHNHFYNVQLHRKQTGGEGPSIDAGMDALSFNYFEFSGNPAPYTGRVGPLYYRGSRSIIIGNRILIRLDAGASNEVIAVDLDRETEPYDFEGTDSAHSIVASGNLIDMRQGGGGANMFGFARNPGDGLDTQESVVLSGNILLGGSRFINGLALLSGGNVWREPKGGGVGITVGTVNIGNSLRGGDAARGRLHDQDLEFFQVSGSTPSVKRSNFLRATAATITNLLDGHVGQEVTIYARTATTVEHSNDIQLNGSTNAVMPTRSTLTLIRVPVGDGGGWQEKSRSF